MPKRVSLKVAMSATGYAYAFSSVASVLTICQSALAQLNVGRYGIQPGLEPEFLQYQIKNQNLNQMRVIPGCNVGFGLSCNKTGSVLQRLLELNGKPSYQELLIRAAGGEKNFQNFGNFYSNNPNLWAIPFASFWKNESPSIMDSYQYLLGQHFGRDSVAGLGLVTKNFYWSPYSEVGNSLNLRNGLLNLKLSYGRLLIEESSKIPNLEQQIRSLGLPPDMTNFYLSNISRGLNALSTGDKNQLQKSIFELLSFPYSKDGGQFGRPNNAIPQELSQLSGENIPGDILLSGYPIALDGEAIALDIIPGSLGDVLVQESESSNSSPLLPVIGGLGLIALLLLLLSGDRSSSSSGQSVAVSNTPVRIGEPVQKQCVPIPNGNGDANSRQVVEIQCNSNPNPQLEVKKVVEPSMIKALVLLIVVLCILRYKRQSNHLKN